MTQDPPPTHPVGNAACPMPMPDHWPRPDGTPIACRDKLQVLADNHVELQSMLRAVFDDAILMGVDDAAMRQILVDLVRALPGPFWRGTAAHPSPEPPGESP